MNKQIIVLVLGVVTLVAAYAAQSFAQYNYCQKPNPNTVECYFDVARVSSCTGLPKVHCPTTFTFEYAVYEVRNFPKGAVPSPVGLTKEEGADCWRKAICLWNEKEQKCQQSALWSPWFVRPKTVKNTDGSCPAPPAGG